MQPTPQSMEQPMISSWQSTRPQVNCFRLPAPSSKHIVNNQPQFEKDQRIKSEQAQRLNIRLHVDNIFKKGYPKKKWFNGMFHAAYEVPVSLSKMVCMKLLGSALTMLDGRFQIDQDDWIDVDNPFTSRYDSVTKQEDVSDEQTS